MARPYRSEMAELTGTLEWVESLDIGDLADDLASASFHPIIAIGSGGSLSAAQHLARLHRKFRGQPSLALTPYDFQTCTIAKNSSYWVFSAGGSNVDVLSAVDAAIRTEPLSLSVVTMSRRTALSKLCNTSSLVRMHQLNLPSKKDGFLATNSLLAFCAVMTRAYLEAAERSQDWIESAGLLHDLLRPNAPIQLSWQENAIDVSGAHDLIVLHDSATNLGALDLESKLTEAATANVQVADYRHFAHGRHHWLAKRAESSAVLALMSGEKSSIAKRTVRLIPPEVPCATVRAPGVGESAQLTSLLAGFFLTEHLSFARGIDPGQPGVPDFGRKIYSLKIPLPQRRSQQDIAIDRKVSHPLASHRQIDQLAIAYRNHQALLSEATFGGLVLDYDGTLVDTSHRFHPPHKQISDALEGLLRNKIPIGIATGRGRSVGRDLRQVLPTDLWSSVIVGYYNGAHIQRLSEGDPSMEEELIDPDLQTLDKGLTSHEILASTLKITLRPYQLTVEGTPTISEDFVWQHVSALVERLNLTNLRVVRSSHSVDVLTRRASKIRVVEAVAAQSAEPMTVLRIGDRGRWPGNDYELLASPWGLSADEVSPDLDHCWNLSPEGKRGASATLYYLGCLKLIDGLGRLAWVRPS